LSSSRKAGRSSGQRKPASVSSYLAAGRPLRSPSCRRSEGQLHWHDEHWLRWLRRCATVPAVSVRSAPSALAHARRVLFGSALRPSWPFRQATPFLQSSRSWVQPQMAGMGGGCVKTPDCNGCGESISMVARDLRANLDFSQIENLTSPSAVLVDRTISSFQN
jgi:hypothetical protein